MTEEHNCAGLLEQTAQSAQSYRGASDQGDETLRTRPVAIHRVGGVPVVIDVGEPFTSGGSVPSARFEISEFFDRPLLDENGGKTDASRQSRALKQYNN
jgi:hypothetical protein